MGQGTSDADHKISRDGEGREFDDTPLEEDIPGTPAAAPQAQATGAGGTPRPKVKATCKRTPAAARQGRPRDEQTDTARNAAALRVRYFAAMEAAQALLKTCDTQWKWCVQTPFHGRVTAAVHGLTVAAHEDQAIRDYLANTATLCPFGDRFVALAEEVVNLEQAVARLQAVGASGET
jgi:hypothetical protein